MKTEQEGVHRVPSREVGGGSARQRSCPGCSQSAPSLLVIVVCVQAFSLERLGRERGNAPAPFRDRAVPVFPAMLQSGKEAGMKETPVALQLYSLRDEMENNREGARKDPAQEKHPMAPLASVQHSLRNLRTLLKG